jgi:hypothetical protein
VTAAPKSLDTITRKHADPTRGPVGVRVVSGTTVLAWYACHLCADRRCDCFENALRDMKRAGAPARLETMAGVVLASMSHSAPKGPPVPMLSLAEHRARPRRTVDEALAEVDEFDEPTDEPSMVAGEDVEDGDDP